jgi:hypothetical protein
MACANALATRYFTVGSIVPSYSPCVQVTRKMTSARRAKLGNDAVNQNVNFAGGILQVISMLHTDDFVQCLVSDKTASPTVMLYLSRQVEFITQLCFCGTQGSVLCFNLTKDRRTSIVSSICCHTSSVQFIIG